MSRNDMTRRQFALGAVAALTAHTMGAQADELMADGLFASARMEAGRASLAIFGRDGRPIATAELPTRGHDTAITADRSVLAIFARRPGTWALVADPASGRVLATLVSGFGRHFVGHGFFRDDDTLVTVEETDIGCDGVLAFRSRRASYAIFDEQPTAGVGPHEAAALPGGRIAIANGGLVVDLATGRDRLDPGSFASDILLLGSDGRAEGQIRLPGDQRLNSVRHMTVAPDGTLAFGCQWQGDETQTPPLLGLVRPDGRQLMISLPDDENRLFRNYIGSVALDASGTVLAATSPRGGIVGLFEVATGRPLGLRRLTDVCGAAPAGVRQFLISSGNAGLRIISADAAASQVVAATDGTPPAFDNHMRRL